MADLAAAAAVANGEEYRRMFEEHRLARIAVMAEQREQARRDYMDKQNAKFNRIAKWAEDVALKAEPGVRLDKTAKWAEDVAELAEKNGDAAAQAPPDRKMRASIERSREWISAKQKEDAEALVRNMESEESELVQLWEKHLEAVSFDTSNQQDVRRSEVSDKQTGKPHTWRHASGQVITCGRI